jgi:hypothetical protein
MPAFANGGGNGPEVILSFSLAPFAPLRETRFFRSLFHSKISNIFG